MKKLFVHSLVLGTLGSPALFAQADAVNSLARARTTFAAADADKDGKLSFDEIQKQKLQIDRRAFDAQDADKDSTWSRDEFAVYYRQTLLNAGTKPAADLENEVARISALRKARAEEEARKRGDVAKDGGPGSGRQAAKEQADAAAIEARLQRAIDDLEKKAEARNATREDFQRVRDSWEARAKAAVAGGAAVGASDPQSKERFERALAALEKRAQENGFDRGEFIALRESLILRAREAQKPDGPAVDAASKPIDIEARLQRAIDELEKKAEARGATREDFQRVRDAWEARTKAALAGDDAGAPDPQVGERFERSLATVEKRARENGYERAELVALRQATEARGRDAQNPAAPPADGAANPVDVEARLERALDELEKKAQARNATREDFQHVREAWEARARAATAGAPTVQPDPNRAEVAARLQRALDDLEKKALAGEWSREEFSALRASMLARARAAVGEKPANDQQSIEARFEDALANLEAKALARNATREDFERVKGLLVQRARAAWKSTNGAPAEAPSDAQVEKLAAEVRSAFERLEQAAQNGTLTREQFADMRAKLVSRARAATKEAPGVAPGEARRGGTGEVKPAEPKPADGGRGGASPPKPESTPPAPAPAPKEREKPPPKPDGQPPR